MMVFNECDEEKVELLILSELIDEFKKVNYRRLLEDWFTLTLNEGYYDENDYT